MNFVRKTAIPLAIVVAIAIQILALAEYWNVEPFGPLFWLAPVLFIILGLTVIWSIIAIFAYHGVRRVLPSALVAVSLALTSVIPYFEISMHIDFKSKQPAMTDIALKTQQARLPFDITHIHALETGKVFIEYELPKAKRYLVEGENLYTSDVECGKFVFFPTFYGIPDGVGGFLYVPECAKPEHFPGGRLGAKWFGVSRIEGRWFRIDGT